MRMMNLIHNFQCWFVRQFARKIHKPFLYLYPSIQIALIELLFVFIFSALRWLVELHRGEIDDRPRPER